MSDIIEVGIPMWGIGGDKELDQQAAIIAETRMDIKKTDKLLDELEEQLETLSKRSNMYIKSTIQIHDYDHLKHILFIDDKLKAHIYLREDYEKVDSFEEISKSNKGDSIQLSKKQADKIIELMYEYNGLIDDYEDFTEAYDDLVAYHEEVWEEVISSLTDFSGLHVYDPDDEEEVEPFDLEKHTLLVIKDENDRWVFRYIRQEDEEEFNKTIEDEINKLK